MCLKKLAVLTMCFWIGCSSLKNQCAEAKDAVVQEKKMIVTAYYKPHRNQEEYITGSYRREVRLNGIGERTSSGTVPRSGTIAADPKVFPKGTVLYIPGYGLGTVEDTGANIKGNRLDVFIGEGDSARKIAEYFGRKRLRVKVILKA